MNKKNLNFVVYLGVLLSLGLANSVFAMPDLFERDLSFGLQNDSDVLRLQEFLTKEGVYNGPTNGSFYALTKEAVIKYQKINNVPATGYVGPITRDSINNRLGKSTVVADNKSAQIQALRFQIDALLKQLAALQAATATPLPPEPVTTTPITPEIVATSTPAGVAATTTPAVPSSFDSTLQIKSTWADYTLTRFSAVTLGEFVFSADEKIAVTKLRFKNVGTLADDSIHGLQLLNSKTNALIATATLDNGSATFAITPDPTKVDNGLLVSGEAYILLADSISASTYGLRYTVEYDIQSESDISAFDYNNLSRVAKLKQVTFPIVGAYIKTY